MAENIRPGPISIDEKSLILDQLGRIAQDKYDEFIVAGGSVHGYDLEKLKGSLQFKQNPETFDNEYWLQGDDDHWTKIAEYFEYGTGLYNTKRAGKYRAGYIKPVVAEYMRFVSMKGGKHWVTTDRVKGVHPIFAMEKSIKYIEFKRANIQRGIRLRLQNG